MSSDAPKAGEYFSRQYLARGVATQDSPAFRTRLAGYLEAKYFKEFSGIASMMKQELGLVVPTFTGPTAVYYEIPKFIIEKCVREGTVKNRGVLTPPALEDPGIVRRRDPSGMCARLRTHSASRPHRHSRPHIAPAQESGRLAVSNAFAVICTCEH